MNFLSEGGSINSELMDELNSLQLFLNNPDPRKSKHFIYLTLREEVKKIMGHEDVLVDILGNALEYMDKNLFVTPDEKHRTLRVLPYLMLLIDGPAENPRSLNIFRTQAINIPRLQSLFVKHPVLPLYADMPIRLATVFERSAHFDRLSMSSPWGCTNNANVALDHDISSHWKGIKEQYNAYSSTLMCVLHEVDHFSFKKIADDLNLRRASLVYQVIRDGLRFLSTWTALISRTLAWKYLHPATHDEMAAAGADPQSPGYEYERAVKLNFSRAETVVLGEVISMIKSLASVLNRCFCVILHYIYKIYR